MRKKLTLRQQLNLCELLALSYENSRKTHKDAENIIGCIYRIAHLNGSCKNEHLDWHKEGHKIGKAFKKYGLGDYYKDGLSEHLKWNGDFDV